METAANKDFISHEWKLHSHINFPEVYFTSKSVEYFSF